jgi:hypothetical protein
MGIKVWLGQLLFLASETTHHERPLIMWKNPLSGDWEGRGRLGIGIGDRGCLDCKPMESTLGRQLVY